MSYFYNFCNAITCVTVTSTKYQFRSVCAIKVLTSVDIINGKKKLQSNSAVFHNLFAVWIWHIAFFRYNKRYLSIFLFFIGKLRNIYGISDCIWFASESCSENIDLTRIPVFVCFPSPVVVIDIIVVLYNYFSLLIKNQIDIQRHFDIQVINSELSL